MSTSLRFPVFRHFVIVCQTEQESGVQFEEGRGMKHRRQNRVSQSKVMTSEKIIFQNGNIFLPKGVHD